MLVLVLLLCYGGAFGQSNFCEQKICVVEFNAGWNDTNSVDWLDSLVNCGVTRILITDKKMLEDVQNKYKIQNVPTIIIFNGKEIERFQACLRFKMGVRQEDVQAIINNAL
jgi:hypothetical protein